MIVGTAGHIDHGKTTLVRALTGVDTDRLPEEHKRGISIELGYAFLDTPAGDRLGFVDVPGHERLVHTMLAGATGIDFALLLVAADDGVMPQTREHLAVLSLLGIAQGAVVVTKVDRADPDRVLAVAAEVRSLLSGSSLDGAPVVEVSAVSGAGMDELRSLLFEAAAASRRPAGSDSAFRLAIDRAFTLGGVGTVVTGTVHAGQIEVGAELSLSPSPAARVLRVRSIHAQNQPVTRAWAGQRCAVALAGVGKEEIDRGQWLVGQGAESVTDRLDLALDVWHGEGRPLRSGTPVHIHLGSASVMGTVAVLDVNGEMADAIAPGAGGRAQLVLRHPICAWHGDRVVLRDASASRTVAGGRVLDPSAPARYRRTPQRLSELDALCEPSAAGRLKAMLAVAPHGVNLARWTAAQGMAPAAHWEGALPDGVLLAQEAAVSLALGANQAMTARQTVLSALSGFHLAHPDELGPDAARLRRLAQPRLPDPLWRALLAGMQSEGVVIVRGAFVHLPEHGVHLSAVEARISQKVAPALAQCAFQGVWARDLARDAGESEALTRTTLARLAQRGELHQVVKDLYYPPSTMATLAAIARRVAGEQGGQVNAAAFRDATGLGRHRAIQILEYFDRVGLLRRVGDQHRLRADSHLFAEEST